MPGKRHAKPNAGKRSGRACARKNCPVPSPAFENPEPLRGRSYGPTDVSGISLVATVVCRRASFGGASAQQQLDVCYYDSNGAQHDADWCVAGGDLSAARTMNLAVYCRSNAGAVCQLGNFGTCRPDTHKYRHYVVFPHMSGQCATTYSAALATGKGGQAIVPTCPPGYVLSGAQCVPDAPATPSCPAGYIFSNGQCLATAAAAASSSTPCRQTYNSCMVEAGKNMHPSESAEMEAACQTQLDACKGTTSLPELQQATQPQRVDPPRQRAAQCLGRGRTCRSTSQCCGGLRCQELSPDVGEGWECQPR